MATTPRKAAPKTDMPTKSWRPGRLAEWLKSASPEALAQAAVKLGFTVPEGLMEARAKVGQDRAALALAEQDRVAKANAARQVYDEVLAAANDVRAATIKAADEELAVYQRAVNAATTAVDELVNKAVEGLDYALPIPVWDEATLRHYWPGEDLASRQTRLAVSLWANGGKPTKKQLTGTGWMERDVRLTNLRSYAQPSRTHLLNPKLTVDERTRLRNILHIDYDMKRVLNREEGLSFPEAEELSRVYLDYLLDGKRKPFRFSIRGYDVAFEKAGASVGCQFLPRDEIIRVAATMGWAGLRLPPPKVEEKPKRVRAPKAATGDAPAPAKRVRAPRKVMAAA